MKKNNNNLRITVGSKVKVLNDGGLYSIHPGRILPKNLKGYKITNNNNLSLDQTFEVIGYQENLNPGRTVIILADEQLNAYWFDYHNQYVKYIKVVKLPKRATPLKPGTKVKILFRPLKKLCEKRGWEYIYEYYKERKGKKHDLILTVIKTANTYGRFKKTDGEYYTLITNTGWDIPTSCFRVIKEK